MIVGSAQVGDAKIFTAKVVDAKIVARGRDDSSALHARPWPQVGEGARCITQRSQAIECRINPAIQRNGGRSEFSRGTRAGWCIFLEIVSERVPARARQLRVVMRPVYVSSDQVTEGAPDDHIGGE